jgi:tRNA pseudouridine38-40 synthase
MRVAIKFAYDGNSYHGYARQLKLKTVEGELIKILVKNGIIEDTKESQFRSASRTDKNVSALSNVISFNTAMSIKNILSVLINQPTSIIFYGIKVVHPDFNPRYANFRRYRYYLKKNDLNIEKIITTSAYFTGEHDFSNFVKLESFRNPIRNIENIFFDNYHEFLIIDFYAQTFLWHQIRRIISALIKVGSGKIDKEQIKKALDIPDEEVDYGLAPAEPLILMDIEYDFEFDYDKKQLKKIEKLEKSIIKNLNGL